MPVYVEVRPKGYKPIAIDNGGAEIRFSVPEVKALLRKLPVALDKLNEALDRGDEEPFEVENYAPEPEG